MTSTIALPNAGYPWPWQKGSVNAVGSDMAIRKGNDSIHHRTNLEDSITISFRYLDSTRNYKLDSSVTIFHKDFRFLPPIYILGISAMPQIAFIFSQFDQWF